MTHQRRQINMARNILPWVADLMEACEGMGPFGSTGSGHGAMRESLAALSDAILRETNG